MGLLAQLKKRFVLGKIRFWRKKDSSCYIPFIRIDNHKAYTNGLVMSPESYVDIKFHRHTETIDQHTNLTRVEMLSAPDGDFIRKTFVTYSSDSHICKPTDFERHFLVYCNSKYLINGRPSGNATLQKMA